MKRFALALLLFAATILPAAAQTYYDIDVDLPAYPEMEPIPYSPVYYAPGIDSNYFFYDGQFWDYFNDGWYSSPWYNGPWVYIEPVYVPTYILWVPIRYYKRLPAHFHHGHRDRPPRWSEHWGPDWQRRHNAVYSGQATNPPARAPLPHYQRQYTRHNYPRAVQQQVEIHAQNYRHQPQAAPKPQQPQQPQQNPAERTAPQQNPERASPREGTWPGTTPRSGFKGS